MIYFRSKYYKENEDENDEMPKILTGPVPIPKKQKFFIAIFYILAFIFVFFAFSGFYHAVSDMLSYAVESHMFYIKSSTIHAISNAITWGNILFLVCIYLWLKEKERLP